MECNQTPISVSTDHTVNYMMFNNEEILKTFSKISQPNSTN